MTRRYSENKTPLLAAVGQRIRAERHAAGDDAGRVGVGHRRYPRRADCN